MRESLKKLIEQTIVYQYDLPNNDIWILNTDISTENDTCYKSEDKDDLIDIIYNSIVDYSFNEHSLTSSDYDKLISIALKTKIKYKSDASELEKIKYGFYGEVLLYALLVTKYSANPLISRWYFYNPLENSETKWYDSYHLLDTGREIQLWFWEAKFHGRYNQGINSILKSIEKALSDDYLDKNLLAISTRKQDFNIKGSRIEAIIDSWEEDPNINLLSELQKHSIKLVYPILLLYEQWVSDYDEMIKKAVKYIKDNHETKWFSLSIDFSIFFIFLPLKEVKLIKQQVIQCIESKKPLIS